MENRSEQQKAFIPETSIIKIADSMYNEGNFKQAEAFYAKYSAQQPSDKAKIRGLRAYIHCRLAQDKLKEALEDADKFLTVFPRYIEVKSTCLYVKVYCGSLTSLESIAEEIEKVYNTKMLMPKDDPMFLLERVFVLYRGRRVSESLKLLKDRQHIFIDDLSMCQRFGEMFLKLGRSDKAMIYLQYSISQNINTPRLWYLRAIASGMSGNLTLARNSADRVKNMYCSLPFVRDLDKQIDKFAAECEWNIASELKKIFFPWSGI